jgi:hypothetical protein
MAKTYPAIGPFTAGDILTAATMTDIETNLDNQRVPPMCQMARLLLSTLTPRTLTRTACLRQRATTLRRRPQESMGSTLACKSRATATGQRAAVIIINPTFSGSGDSAVITAGTRAAGSYTNALGSGLQTSLSVSSTFSLAEGDTVALLAFQNAGGALSFTTGAEQTALSLTWLGQVS